MEDTSDEEDDVQQPGAVDTRHAIAMNEAANEVDNGIEILDDAAVEAGKGNPQKKRRNPVSDTSQPARRTPVKLRVPPLPPWIPIPPSFAKARNTVSMRQDASELQTRIAFC